uniref:Uncharacterized protein n=1 Tax=Siphoviridae sp. ctv2R2 TaxID=2823609 RepID=A0A8S5LAC8_9CAUD|nr:MAG TPA: hypothetical protein [Siphoviridae sp. ctv2R2]
MHYVFFFLFQYYSLRSSSLCSHYISTYCIVQCIK